MTEHSLSVCTTLNTVILLPPCFGYDVKISSGWDWHEDTPRPCSWWSMNCLNVEPDKSLHQWIQFPQYCVWCGIFPSSLWQPYIFIVKLTDLTRSDVIIIVALHSQPQHTRWITSYLFSDHIIFFKRLTQNIFWQHYKTDLFTWLSPEAFVNPIMITRII